MEPWTIEQRVFVYDTFILTDKSIEETQRRFRSRFNVDQAGAVPSRPTILKWYKNVTTTGSLIPGKSSGGDCTPENVETDGQIANASTTHDLEKSDSPILQKSNVAKASSELFNAVYIEEENLNETDESVVSHTTLKTEPSENNSNIVENVATPKLEKVFDEDMKESNTNSLNDYYTKAENIDISNTTIYMETEKNICNEPAAFKCDSCGVAFIKKGDLKEHLKMHTDEKCLLCKICEESFPNKHKLQSHMHIHTNKKLHKCGFCDKVFPKKAEWKYHLRKHNREKLFECYTCGKKITQKKLLVKHIRSHTGEKAGEGPTKCTYCGKLYTRVWNLKEHIKIHTTEKPLQCDVCSINFTQKVHLVEHMKIHSNDRPQSGCDEPLLISSD